RKAPGIVASTVRWKSRLVCPQVKKEVYGKGVGARLGKLVKIIFMLGFAFPAVTVVGIVRRDDHNTLAVIQPGANVHVFGPFAPEARNRTAWVGCILVTPPEVYGRHL